MKNWVRGIALLLTVALSACGQQTANPLQFAGDSIYGSIDTTGASSETKTLIKEVLQSLTIRDGLVSLDELKVPTSVSVAEMNELVLNVNNFASSNGIHISTPKDFLSVFNSYSGPGLILPDSKSSLQKQQVGAYSCRGVTIKYPHKSNDEANTIKAKAGGSCNFYKMNLSSPTWKLYLYLEIQKGSLFKYWSKVSQAGPYTRTGYTGTWSDTKTVVRKSPCVNGNYKASGSVSISVPNATVLPRTTSLNAVTNNVQNCS